MLQPSFGDEVFDVSESTSATTSLGHNNNSFMYQQNSAQTKRMISLHNTSDEYHTANEESFTTNTSLMNTTTNNNNNNGQTPQQPGGGSGGDTSVVTSTTTTPTTMAARKQMIPLEQSEPAKPHSAYALFFRDTVSAIKQQNPSCSFQELTQIVASMWKALDPAHINVYNKKSELARNEYIKQMKVYRQQQQTQEQNSNNTIMSNNDMKTTAINSSPQQQQIIVTNTNNDQQQQPNTTTPPTVTNNVVPSSTNTDVASTSVPSNDQPQTLNESNSLQMCTRENCNKRAILHPDWEDEYCSNECVIIHCRNVFNAWVKSNTDAKSQEHQPTTT